MLHTIVQICNSIYLTVKCTDNFNISQPEIPPLKLSVTEDGLAAESGLTY